MAFLGRDELSDKELIFDNKEEAEAAHRKHLKGKKLQEGKDKDWSRRLNLGPEIYISSDKQVRQLRKGESVSIEPGEFALMLTEQFLALPPSVVGFIAMRTEFKLRGLVNISGFHVDPNYVGRLLFSVYNAGPNPVMVRRGDELFMIVLSRVPPQGEKSKIRFEHIDTRYAGLVRGPPYSLIKLHERVQQLGHRVTTLIAILGALVVSLIVGVIIFLLERSPTGSGA